jgi:UDP:flavonoid glycosyltransferase YjiC (YdhE family)
MDKAIWRMTRNSINALGKEIDGLEPYSHYARPAAKRCREMTILYAISPRVYPKPVDWGENIHLTGYWFLPRSPAWTPPTELVSFLESGEKPIYFGFGSMPSADPTRMIASIRETLARLGKRGIVNKGWAGLDDSRAASAELMFVDDVPHDWLFPRVSVAVHHGGVGTAAAALRAGIPSVIVPHVGDQPMWGRILHGMGAAPASIPANTLSTDRLERALREALADGRMREKAREISAALSAEDGVACAVTAIESFMSARAL